jgi:hypothetical protein
LINNVDHSLSKPCARVSWQGRLWYACQMTINVKSKSDLRADQYIIKLQTLFSHEWQQSVISNELALAQALRYINVPGKELRQAGVVNIAVHPGC